MTPNEIVNEFDALCSHPIPLDTDAVGNWYILRNLIIKALIHLYDKENVK